MAKSASPKILAGLIVKLRAQRQEHIDAIVAIESMFKKHGIDADIWRRRKGKRNKSATHKKKTEKTQRKKVARTRGKSKAGKKRTSKKTDKRRSFTKTADELILSLLKGQKKMTTAEINGKWKQARRGGTADNTLSKLGKKGILKKDRVAGARGSYYSLA